MNTEVEKIILLKSGQNLSVEKRDNAFFLCKNDTGTLVYLLVDHVYECFKTNSVYQVLWKS